MSLHNEVFKNCPECGCQCEMQISQVVIGNGGFFLDSPIALEIFSMEELIKVKELVQDKLFYCQECGHNFPAIGGITEQKHQVIKDLFGI